jgi:hypothetical protein
MHYMTDNYNLYSIGMGLGITMMQYITLHHLEEHTLHAETYSVIQCHYLWTHCAASLTQLRRDRCANTYASAIGQP